VDTRGTCCRAPLFRPRQRADWAAYVAEVLDALGITFGLRPTEIVPDRRRAPRSSRPRPGRPGTNIFQHGRGRRGCGHESASMARQVLAEGSPRFPTDHPMSRPHAAVRAIPVRLRTATRRTRRGDRRGKREPDDLPDVETVVLASPGHGAERSGQLVRTVGRKARAHRVDPDGSAGRGPGRHRPDTFSRSDDRPTHGIPRRSDCKAPAQDAGASAKRCQPLNQGRP